MKRLFSIIGISMYIFCFAQIERVEPMNWWVGMKDHSLQLLIKEKNISESTPTIAYQGVELKKVHLAASPNYVFLD